MQKIAETQVKSRDTAIFCFSTVKDRIIYIVGISVNTFFKNILTFLLQPDYC